MEREQQDGIRLRASVARAQLNRARAGKHNATRPAPQTNSPFPRRSNTPRTLLLQQAGSQGVVQAVAGQHHHRRGGSGSAGTFLRPAGRAQRQLQLVVLRPCDRLLPLQGRRQACRVQNGHTRASAAEWAVEQRRRRRRRRQRRQKMITAPATTSAASSEPSVPPLRAVACRREQAGVSTRLRGSEGAARSVYPLLTFPPACWCRLGLVIDVHVAARGARSCERGPVRWVACWCYWVAGIGS